MSKIQIMTDSASDISYEDEKKYDIAVIPFPINLADKDYVSRVDFNNEQFYELMEKYDEVPKTSQITPYQFQEIYLEQAKAGVTELILILINSKGSSTYQNSVQAIGEFYEEYPQYASMKIHSFDGLGYSALYGEPAVIAARMAKEGETAERIVEYLTDTLPKRQIYFGIYNLKYAAKSGRIPLAAAFLGNALNLKPVMKIFSGDMITAHKCRGEKHLVENIARMSVEDMEAGAPYEIIYGNDTSCLEELKQLMIEKTGYEPANIYQIGAAVAANAGPKVVGVGFIKSC